MVLKWWNGYVVSCFHSPFPWFIDLTCIIILLCHSSFCVCVYCCCFCFCLLFLQCSSFNWWLSRLLLRIKPWTYISKKIVLNIILSGGFGSFCEVLLLIPSSSLKAKLFLFNITFFLCFRWLRNSELGIEKLCTEFFLLNVQD